MADLTNGDKSNDPSRPQPKPATPSPAKEKVSGPAMAEPSKVAKAPKSGGQPGAYVKDNR